MTPCATKPAARELIAFYLDAGVNASSAKSAVDRFADEPAPLVPRTPRSGAAGTAPCRARRPKTPRRPLASHGRPCRLRCRRSAEAAVMAAREAAAARATLDELRALLGDSKAARSRDRHPTGLCRRQSAGRVMFVGEAPGRDEEIAGLPFVGRSGKLLDLMLAAIGLDRSASLHRQHRAVAAAGKPHADAAGDRDLPAVHPPPDRACQSRHPGLPRPAGDADAARRSRKASPERAAAGSTSTPAAAKSARCRLTIRPFCCAVRCRSGSPGGISWRSKRRSQAPPATPTPLRLASKCNRTRLTSRSPPEFDAWNSIPFCSPASNSPSRSRSTSSFRASPSALPRIWGRSMWCGRGPAPSASSGWPLSGPGSSPCRSPWASSPVSFFLISSGPTGAGSRRSPAMSSGH